MRAKMNIECEKSKDRDKSKLQPILQGATNLETIAQSCAVFSSKYQQQLRHFFRDLQHEESFRLRARSLRDKTKAQSKLQS